MYVITRNLVYSHKTLLNQAYFVNSIMTVFSMWKFLETLINLTRIFFQLRDFK